MTFSLSLVVHIHKKYPDSMKFKFPNEKNRWKDILNAHMNIKEESAKQQVVNFPLFVELMLYFKQACSSGC